MERGFGRESYSEIIACEGVGATESFIRELGLPTALRDIGIDEKTDLRQISASCILSAGSYKHMTHKDIFEVFQECY